MKVRIRTTSGEFRDDLNHFTEKWTEVDESRCRGEYLDNPKLEVQFPKEKASSPEETE